MQIFLAHCKVEHPVYQLSQFLQSLYNGKFNVYLVWIFGRKYRFLQSKNHWNWKSLLAYLNKGHNFPKHHWTVSYDQSPLKQNRYSCALSVDTIAIISCCIRPTRMYIFYPIFTAVWLVLQPIRGLFNFLA